MRAAYWRAGRVDTPLSASGRRAAAEFLAQTRLTDRRRANWFVRLFHLVGSFDFTMAMMGTLADTILTAAQRIATASMLAQEAVFMSL